MNLLPNWKRIEDLEEQMKDVQESIRKIDRNYSTWLPPFASGVTSETFKEEPEVCECGEWEPGIAEVNAQLMFCATQFAAPRYTAPPFQFCPWCGGRSREWEGG